MVYKDKNKQREYIREWCRRNKDKVSLYNKRAREKRPNAQNDWNKKNPERAQAISKRAYRNNREKRIADSKRWIKNNPDKVKITKLREYKKNEFKYKVREQTISKFKQEKNYGVCKSTKDLEYHHWVYKKPVERKDFSTLCKDCHKTQHGGVLWKKH